MNYEPNTIIWGQGDFVIHDFDAKRHDMIMQVIGYQKNGLCKTVYFYNHKWEGKKKRVYKNDIKYLHPLGAFGIREPDKDEEQPTRKSCG